MISENRLQGSQRRSSPFSALSIVECIGPAAFWHTDTHHANSLIISNAGQVSYVQMAEQVLPDGRREVFLLDAHSVLSRISNVEFVPVPITGASFPAVGQWTQNDGTTVITCSTSLAARM